jgi:hypothetical protein
MLPLKAQSLLWHQNFDSSTTTGTLPAGWSNTALNAYSHGWAVDSTNFSNTYTGFSAQKNVVVKNVNNSTGIYGLITPPFSTVGKAGISLNFASRVSSNFIASGSSTPQFYFSINNGSTWDSILYADNAANSTWGIVNGGLSIQLPPKADNQSNVKFKWSIHIDTASQGTYRIDDINVFYLNSVCLGASNLTANNLQTNSANISWNAVLGAVSYSIRYRDITTSTWQYATSIPNSTSLGGLIPATTYEFQIQVNCANSQTSAYSNSVNFTTAALPCSVPTGLNTSALSANNATINWTLVSGALSYNLQYRATGAGTWNTVNCPSNSYVLSALTANTSYDVEVQTVCNGSNNSAYSNIFTFTTSNLSCDTTTSFQVTNITSVDAVANWTAVSNAISYNVNIKESAASTWNNYNTANLSYLLSGLIPMTNYDLTIQSVCSSTSSSVLSSVLNFSTLNPPCDTVTGLAVNSITQNSANVSWTSAINAVNYSVDFKMHSASNWTNSSIPSNTVSLTGLAPNTLYDVRVKTDCGNNNFSNYSSIVSFTTLGTGINQPMQTAIVVTPNPTSDFITIHSPIQIQRLQIYNLLGECVLQSNILSSKTAQIDLSNLTPGQYVVFVETTQHTRSQATIVKQ